MSSTVYYNRIIFDEIFRAKPYTKCFDCLRCPGPRCKKCMKIIINKISTEQFLTTVRTNGNTFSKNYSTPRFSKRNYTVGKNRREDIQIMNKYQNWMEEVKKKKKKSMESNTISQWPRKTPLKDFNLIQEGSKTPKYEKWKRKMVDKFHNQC